MGDGQNEQNGQQEATGGFGKRQATPNLWERFDALEKRFNDLEQRLLSPVSSESPVIPTGPVVVDVESEAESEAEADAAPEPEPAAPAEPAPAPQPKPRGRKVSAPKTE